MDFGKLLPQEIDSIDFKLPPDHPLSITQQPGSNTNFQFFLGAPKIVKKSWVGQLYRVGIPDSGYLQEYANFFNCIEFNGTFYQMPNFQQCKTWADQVPDYFRFIPKITGSISHQRRLNAVRELTDNFLEGISGFGAKVDSIFMVLHPGMSPTSINGIESFISSFPKDLTLHLELRHPAWFNASTEFNYLAQLMKDQGHSLVITDTAGRRDVIHQCLTKKEVLIRFVGNDLHSSDFTRVQEWIQRINLWRKSGIQQVTMIIHQPEDTSILPIARLFQTAFESITTNNLPSVQIKQDQLPLF